MFCTRVVRFTFLVLVKKCRSRRPTTPRHHHFVLFQTYWDSGFHSNYAPYIRAYNTSVTPPTPCARLRGGIVALAIECTSPWKDFCYNQWLTMFHDWKGEVQSPEDELQLVPPKHRWYAACLVLEPDSWTDDDRVFHSFAATAMGSAQLVTFRSMQRCWRTNVGRFLAGEVVHLDPVVNADVLLPLNDEQRAALNSIIMITVLLFAVQVTEGVWCG